MKKVLTSILSFAVAAMVLNAQEASPLQQATEMYNNGAAALGAGDKTGALQYFENAVTMANALGEEGKSILDNCKNVLPSLNLSIAKDLLKANSFDAAVEKLKSVITIAESYEAFDVMGEATELIPQIKMKKAVSLYNAKDFAGAVEAYKDVLNDNPANGIASLRLGAAYSALGDIENAKAAYEAAALNGQETSANKQLGNIYLKTAASCLKAKNYVAAMENAIESTNYIETPQAYRIAGQAAQISNNNASAIEYLSKYLEIAPNAKDAGQVAYTLGYLYQSAKNTAKAKEYYQKAVTDPQYGADAKKILESLN